jgi:butyryl-CoA dehydrogenase
VITLDFTLNKEQEKFRNNVQRFCETEVKPLAKRIEEEGQVPGELIRKMAKLGLFGLPFDKKHGGSGRGFLLANIALEELARASGGVSLCVAINYLTSIPIDLYGTEEQKVRFITSLARGEAIGSMAFTEAATGADFGAITTRAELKENEYIVNGSKRFITASEMDGPIVFFARDGERVSAFIGQKNTTGYKVPEPWKKLGLRGISLTDIHFENYLVPAANLLGTSGNGANILRDTIAVGKLDTSAIMLGCAQAALDEAVKYAKRRKVRGKPIAGFQTIQCLLSEMAVSIEAARLMVYRLATYVDLKKDVRVESAMTKMFVTEIASEVARKSMKVHGAYGYVTDLPIERIVRDIHAGEIIEGSNEIQRVIVAADLLK